MNDRKLTKQELKEISERCNKATAGIWLYNETTFELDEIVDSSGKTIFHIGTYLEEDAEFIAHAREDIPKLLNELGESREHSFSFEHLWFDQKKENEQLAQEITQLKRENEHLLNELANKMV